MRAFEKKIMLLPMYLVLLNSLFRSDYHFFASFLLLTITFYSVLLIILPFIIRFLETNNLSMPKVSKLGQIFQVGAWKRNLRTPGASESENFCPENKHSITAVVIAHFTKNSLLCDYHVVHCCELREKIE